nr:hypothetical protein [Tanacetum cinerariifolium]
MRWNGRDRVSAFEQIGQRREVRGGRAHRPRVRHNGFELIGAQSGGQAASGADEQLIVVHVAQTPQRRADRRLSNAQAQRCTAGAGFIVQGFKDF